MHQTTPPKDTETQQTSTNYVIFLRKIKHPIIIIILQ